MAVDEVTGPVATVLLVFGHGVVATAGGYDLTPGSRARVTAAAAYVHTHRDAFHAGGGRVIFTGGWAEAAEGAGEPPAGCREGDLMVRAARAIGLDGYADLRTESRSRSTLENLLHTAADGLLADHVFTPRHPLGIVSDGWHLPRIRLLAGKVLGLRGPQLLDIAVVGGVPRAGRRSELIARLAARVWLTGAGQGAVLIRRERRLVASLRVAERLVRRTRK